MEMLEMLLEMNLLWERDAPGGREDRPASLNLDASAMLANRGVERSTYLNLLWERDAPGVREERCYWR